MAHKDDPHGSVSRRDFFKTVGAGSVATGVLTAMEAEGRSGRPAIGGPGGGPVRLTVNGRTHARMLEPRVTLLGAVPVRLDLTGSNRVCDRGTCGACTRIVDGRAV